MVDGPFGQSGQAVVYYVQMAQGQGTETVVILFLSMAGILVMGSQLNNNSATKGHVQSMVDGQLGQVGPNVL